MYVQRLRNSPYADNPYAAYGYDAVWAIALALNRSMDVLAKTNRSLGDFTYHSSDVNAVLKRALSAVKFQGMTVRMNRHREIRTCRHKVNPITVSKEWSIWNFPCSLTRNITSHSIKNLYATNSHYLTHTYLYFWLDWIQGVTNRNVKVRTNMPPGFCKMISPKIGV